MPISEIEGCDKQHWVEVKSIIEESVIDAACDPLLVSEGEEVGIIQKRIVQNLYDNEIVVCDVSCRNPNVMFELGMRLAFDKPTIVIKDSDTHYPFDTSPLEYLEYPRDLRFGQILEFKSRLTSKITHTLEATKRTGKGAFLSSFGDFKSVKIKSTEISSDQFVIDELKRIRTDIGRLDRSIMYQNDYSSMPRRPSSKPGRFERSLCLADVSVSDVKKIREFVDGNEYVERTFVRRLSPDHSHIDIDFANAPSALKRKWFAEIKVAVKDDFGVSSIVGEL